MRWYLRSTTNAIMSSEGAALQEWMRLTQLSWLYANFQILDTVEGSHGHGR